MKKKIIITVAAILVIGVLAVLAIKFGTGTDEAENIEPYRFSAELDTELQTLDNGKVKLEFDPTTAQFVFTDANGTEWYSNATGESAETRDELQSTMIITYSNSRGISYTYDNYEYSVLKGNYQYEVIEDGNAIEVDFTIGKIEKVYRVPDAIHLDRYEEIYNTLDSDAQKEMKSAYKTLKWDKLDDDEKAEYLELYPDLETTDVAILRDGTQEWKKEKLEGMLEAAGYTEEQYEEDQGVYGIETESENPAVNISVIYRLDGEDLVVEVPYSKIEYTSDYPITDLRILPYMCSADVNETGYMFVPDGSGSLIYFNNGKSNQTSYSSNMYGFDPAVVRDYVIKDPESQFPIFGISYDSKNASLLTIIEQGDSYATIKAAVAGSNYVFNFVTAEFDIVHSEQADVTGRSDSGVYLYEDGLNPDESIVLRMKTVDSTDYVDMAKTYRTYLLNKYPELGTNVSDTLPVAVELIGAVTKTQQILGFPKDRPYALSTYSEMADMVQKLSDDGIDNMTVILNGWFNDGVVHDFADDVSYISALGGKSSFKKMLETLNKLAESIYLEADFTYVYNNSLFDGYTARTDSARFLNREVAEISELSNIYYSELSDGDSYNVAKPSVIMSTIESFLKETENVKYTGIAFRSVGNTLSSDFNRKATVTRETAKSMQTEELASIGRTSVFYTGNEYVLPYADIVLKMPLTSQGANIVDVEVPFFSIVLHGYVDYTGDAVNITGDYVTNLLKSAETGAGLYCVLMAAETSELQDTDETKYFGANFDSWEEDIVKLYERFSTDFAGLYNQTIEDHEYVDDNITKTTYADGTEVYVNYRTADYTADGITIPAQDWVVVRKGGN